MDVTKANLGLNRPSLLLWLFLFFVFKIVILIIFFKLQIHFLPTITKEIIMFIYFTISIYAIICVRYFISMFSFLIFTNEHMTVLNDSIKFETDNVALTHYFLTVHFYTPWKLIFLTPWYAHVKNASFSENVAYALNESCLPFRSSG